MRRSRFLRLSALAMLSFPLVACQGAPSGPTATGTQPPATTVDSSPTASQVAASATAASAPAVVPTVSPTSLPPTPASTATPADATPAPSSSGLPSYFDNATLLTIYGRAWDSAAVLGRLALYSDVNDMAQEVADFNVNLLKANGGKKIIPAIHLIYGMAMPCDAKGNCLYYLDTTKNGDIVKNYIQPAASKGYLVILDSQYGRSDSLTQVKRMIDKGYLKYDNVHVALDPEFHVIRDGQMTPGQPIGNVDVDEINAVQALLDDYVDAQKLAHRKILMVHQFGDPNVNDGVPFMIQNKKAMKSYPNVDLIICADGFGSPDSKLTKYNKMTDPTVYPFLKYRAIKLFLDNPKADQKRIDKPVTTFRMCFGLDAAPNGARAKFKPDCIVIA